MSSLYDLEKAKITNPMLAQNTSTSGVAAEATLTSQGPNRITRVTKIDASYSDSTKSGLLTITGLGVTVQKYIHGSGAIDFADDGSDGVIGTDIVATLAAVASTIATVTISGFWR